MDFNLLQPWEQIVAIMKRIYNGEMTTLSGGNLSYKDDNGDIWITPAGIDKGSLSPGDVVCVKKDGSWEGTHRPSSELPFHRAIYEKRPDLRAVLHAHSPALVAFSISGEIPDTRILPLVNQVCGEILYAPYAMTGSEELGENIANTFSTGVNIVMLENHGVAAGGSNILEAYQRLETLDFCARTILNARGIGDVQVLSDFQLEKFNLSESIPPEFEVQTHTSHEYEKRQEIVKMVHRACNRRMMNSTQGVASVRLTDERFLITPKGADICSLESEDLVLIQAGQREFGKMPNRYFGLHQEIYRMHPEINSIMTAQSPHATAFAITPVVFDSRTIPESYMLLREVKKIPFDQLYANPLNVAQAITDRSPVLLIENDSVLTTGADVLSAYDRLEVLEYTSRSLLELPKLNELHTIDETGIQEIEKKLLGG